MFTFTVYAVLICLAIITKDMIFDAKMQPDCCIYLSWVNFGARYAQLDSLVLSCIIYYLTTLR